MSLFLKFGLENWIAHAWPPSDLSADPQIRRWQTDVAVNRGSQRLGDGDGGDGPYRPSYISFLAQAVDSERLLSAITRSYFFWNEFSV